MKRDEIRVGGTYRAKVAGRLTTVRVDAIRQDANYKTVTVYDVTNLVTQRKTQFFSAAKFRCEAKQAVPVGAVNVAEVFGCPAGTVEMGEVATVDNGNGTSEATVPMTYTPPEASIEVVTPTPEMAEAITTAIMPTSLSSAFAAVSTVSPTTTSRHPLTDEQQAIVDAVRTEQVLVIEAGAGAGKTSTLLAVSEALGGRGQYTAFNASLVAESKGKFDPSRTQCNTVHSLAFRSEGIRFKHRLNGPRVMGSEVAAMLGISQMTVLGADDKDKVLSPSMLAGVVSRAVKQFTQSADREVGAQHFGRTPVAGLLNDDQQAAVVNYLLPYASAMWADMADPDGKMPYIGHDAYVKVWELSGAEISAAYLLVDEAQDLSPVMLSIASQQVVRGMRVILVGDSQQQIYTWRGCVNALAAFPDAKRLYLTMSFRFGPVGAEVANAILDNLDQPTQLEMRGFDRVPTRLAAVASPDCVLCRTNGGAVQTVLTAMGQGKRPHLIGGGADVLAFVRAARDLKAGKRTEHPELACFDSWGEVEAYAKTDDGEDLRVMVKLIKDFTADAIIKAISNMPDEKDADLVVSTAHKSKGREWDTVRLCNDFKPLSKMDDEELRLLYVAATRAKLVLDVESCAPFCGGGERDNDELDQRGEYRKCRVVDLKEARRLSKLVVVPTTKPGYNTDGSKGLLASDAIARGEKFEGGSVMTAPQVEDKPKPDYIPEVNTWTKSKSGSWVVRGKPGQSGVVTVERRNGSKSQERLGRVIWQDQHVALYEVVGK